MVIRTELFFTELTIDYTECPKIYRKSVLHLHEYFVNLYFNKLNPADAVQICGKFRDTQYMNNRSHGTYVNILRTID